jgi:hypothetical protein
VDQRQKTNPVAQFKAVRLPLKAIVAGAFLLLGTAPAPAQNTAPVPPSAPPRGAQPRPHKPFVFNVPGILYSEQFPNNFAVPPYTSNVVKKHFMASTKGQPSATASLVTKDQINVVFDWYKNACKDGGWTFKTPNSEGAAKLSKSGQLYMIDGKKEKQQIYIFCNPDKKSGGTAVTISWMKLKK